MREILDNLKRTEYYRDIYHYELSGVHRRPSTVVGSPSNFGRLPQDMLRYVTAHETSREA